MSQLQLNMSYYMQPVIALIVQDIILRFSAIFVYFILFEPFIPRCM